MKLILGSASQSRQHLLKQAGYEFTVVHADIDEKSIRDPDAQKLALRLAHAKADALMERIIEPALLITVDQVVICHGEIFEKPADADEARHYMHSYALHPATTVTAVVVFNTATGKRAEAVDLATVYFIPIPEAVVEALIVKGDIFHCAGGFQVESDDGELNAYVDHVDGAVDGVKGLPIAVMQQLLLEVSS